jgi:hypothetical protein
LAHAVFISESPKLPGPVLFRLRLPGRSVYNVLLAKDLRWPKFGIRPVIHRPGVAHQRDADIFAVML